MNSRRISLFLLISIAAGLLLGALIAWLGGGVPLRDAAGFTLTGWAAAFFLSAISIFLILLAWNWAGRLKFILIVMLLAFALRLGIGVALGLGLDKWGHYNMENEAGYLFLDPYRRDTDAWKLAQSGESLVKAFREGFSNDQYGGLLTTSALIYRTLSPDGHRPFLINILAAFAGAIGVAFLWMAVQPRWGKRIAGFACCVLAFYPEAILQGSSQTREPFVIALVSILFWLTLTWSEQRVRKGILFGLTLLTLAFFNTLAAVAALAFLAVWFVIDLISEKTRARRTGWLWILIGGAALVLLAAGSIYLLEYAKWDARESLLSSGFVQTIIDKRDPKFLVPFMTIYGLLQPLLPATIIAQSAKPLWTGIGIFHAAGWYLLLPFLVYALILVWKEKEPRQRKLLAWLMLFSAVWVIISSLRAGGDQWDNPRYRIIFLPLLALLAAWVLDRVIKQRDSWFVCLLIWEALFILLFLLVYIFKYYGTVIFQYNWKVALVILGVAGILLFAGNFLRLKARKKA